MKVLLFCPAYEIERVNLQPWKYFDMVGEGLCERGHEVAILSIGRGEISITKFEKNDLTIDRIRQNPLLRKELKTYLERNREARIIISIGPFTSILRDPIEPCQEKRIGIITFPIYRIHELRKIGFLVLLRNWRQTYQLILAAFFKRTIISSISRSVEMIICESESNAKIMKANGIAENRIGVILPGVDDEFLICPEIGKSIKKTEKPIITYMGSSLPVRGVFDLVTAFEELNANATLRLLIREDQGTEKNIIQLKKRTNGIRDVEINLKNITREEMIEELRRSTVVVFPFKLMPSEMPVGPLEALSCNANVIIPRIGGLTELEKYGALCYEPGDCADLRAKILTALETKVKVECSRAGIIQSWNSVAEMIDGCLQRKGYS